MILALFISICIIFYYFYTMTLRWGIFVILLIIFTLFWSKNPNLKEKSTPFLIVGLVIGISFIIYSFYMHTLVWGSIHAMFAMIIIVLFITFFRWFLTLCVSSEFNNWSLVSSHQTSIGLSFSVTVYSVSTSLIFTPILFNPGQPKPIYRPPSPPYGLKTTTLHLYSKNWIKIERMYRKCSQTSNRSYRYTN